MRYDNRGRIENNTSLGDYAYDKGNTYRLQTISPNESGRAYFGENTVQNVSYNAYKKPVEIRETGKGRVSFEYGPMMSRSTAYYGGEDEDRLSRRYRKHYSSILPVEIVEDTGAGSTKIVNYIAGDAYTAPIVHIKQTGTNTIDAYHYLHRDYLGSILAITDAQGAIKEKRQFGAWGTVDKFLSSNGNTTFDHSSLLGRGYTGHEHFFEVGLIHMNGRMYDANLGRVLSPDNYIHNPYNTQDFNRYSYTFNNPLMYNDPNGEEPILIGLAIVGAIIGAAAIFGDWEGASNASNTPKSSAPTPGSQSNSEMVSSVSSGQSRSGGGSRGGFEGATATIHSPVNRISLPKASINISSSDSGVYGVSQTGRPNTISFLDEAPEQDFSGFWGKAEYYLTGGNIDGYRYNIDGQATGIAPIMGLPPSIGIGKIGSFTNVVKQATKWARAARGSNVVYTSVSRGVTQYVGITNNFARRSAQHLASKGINIEPFMKGLSRSDARAVEQALIEIHGLGKNGGTLLNKINSISTKNPIYGQSLQRGYDLLKSIGY